MMRESLKPIEPGCLAMVVSGHRIGAMVRVVKMIDPHPGPCPICRTTSPKWQVLLEGKECTGCELGLLRIDPDEDQRKAWEREEQKLTLDPAELARRIRETDR